MHPFERRNPRLWTALERLSVLVFASLMFWLFSALVITLPAALVGLFAAVGGLVRSGATDSIGRFWHGFRRTFGRALLLGLAHLALGGLLYADIRFFWSMGTPLARVTAASFGSLAVAGSLAAVFAWPLLAWYPQPLAPLLRRSFLLGAAHPFQAMAGLGGSALALIVLLILPGPLLGLLPAIGPAAAAIIISLAAWQAMRRYAGSEDESADE